MFEFEVDVCDASASLTIDCPFLDEAAAIALFVEELLKALEGPIVDELIDALTNLLLNELKTLLEKIITNIFGSFTLYGSIPNPVLIVTLPDPVLRIIADIDPAKIIADAEQLIAMGMKTIGDAISDFLQCLVDSLMSSYVVTALLNIIEHFLRAGAIYQMIVQMVRNFAVSVGFSGYVSFPIPQLVLPYIEIPTVALSVTGPCGFTASAELTAELSTIETFQSKLMAPKMYDVIVPIQTALVTVVSTELPSIIQDVFNSFGLTPV